LVSEVGVDLQAGGRQQIAEDVLASGAALCAGDVTVPDSTGGFEITIAM
jgi:hypothetical protein